MLFISPHLDDVAFSCGGTLLRLAERPQFRVVLCTIFTASVENPAGFALRCQTDKGIAPEVDYMALRRAEDKAFAAFAGVKETRHLNHREAPHRGYHSPNDLFAGIRPDDEVWEAVRADLAALEAEFQPVVVFAPLGLGNHVDHLQTIRAVLRVYLARRVLWYRDTPYAIRSPSARPSALVPPAVQCPSRVPLNEAILARKIDGCCLYASQINFQFGGPAGVRDKLIAFHCAEAGGETKPPAYAEVLMGGNLLDFPLPK